MSEASNTPRRGVVYAGMYAVGSIHRAAWQNWFDELSKLVLNQQYDSLELRFSTDDSVYTDGDTIMAQTCGYPYVKKWQATHDLIAVPLFDVAGCGSNGENSSADQRIEKSALSSSWFITHVDNPAQSLNQFQGKRVAINSEDSNSGMNVLRYATSKVATQKHFFAKQLITGSHLKSMQAIAEEQADLASIDAVSYALIGELEPSILERIKIIGQSEMTTGLPFICSKKSKVDQHSLYVAMGQAVVRMESKYRDAMHLVGFTTVRDQDFKKTRNLELLAMASNQAKLSL